MKGPAVHDTYREIQKTAKGRRSMRRYGEY